MMGYKIEINSFSLHNMHLKCKSEYIPFSVVIKNFKKPHTLQYVKEYINKKDMNSMKKNLLMEINGKMQFFFNGKI